MKLKIFLIITCLIVFAPASFSANVWQSYTYIEGVQAMHTGGYILYLPPDSSLPCQEGGKLFNVVPNQNGMTLEGSKNLLSVALVAYSTKKKVSVLYDNSSSSCYVQQIHLRHDS